MPTMWMLMIVKTAPCWWPWPTATYPLRFITPAITR